MELATGGKSRTCAPILAALACFSLAGAPVHAQDAEDAPFGPEQLEQVVAPIALYPDSLLAQVLMASTYPLEVVEAARFAEENPGLKDAALDDALKEKSWDPSVKSLISFPQVITMMNEKLDWTQQLGDAFLAQQKDVMDAVQRLRARAHAEGNLESNEQQKIIVEQAPPTEVTVEQAPTEVVVQQAPPTVIQIEQTNPQVIYVPAYNPTVVYGTWPYPTYPPYSYYPPGYIAGSALWFGAGMAVGAAVWGDCDWGGGDVDIDVNEYNNFNKNTSIDRGDRTNIDGGRGEGGRGRDGERGRADDRGRQGDRGGKSQWKHDPSHRKGAQYRDKGTQQRYDRSGPKGAESREAFRGRAEQGREQMKREGTSAVQRDVDRASARDRSGATSRDRAGEPQRTASSRDRAGNTSRDRSGDARSSGSRDRASAGSQRSGSSSRSSADRGRGSDAFKGVGQGSQVRRDSSRGQASRSSASRGSRGGGGGGGGGRGGGGGGRRR
jgi:Protein of unknown function (DUF3300)